jgi:hypothetical protein
MAAVPNPRSQIGGGVPFKADGKNSPRRAGNAALKQIGSTLRQKLGFAGTGASDDASVVC